VIPGIFHGGHLAIARAGGVRLYGGWLAAPGPPTGTDCLFTDPCHDPWHLGLYGPDCLEDSGDAQTSQ
jgi:hypothetical protein